MDTLVSLFSGAARFIGRGADLAVMALGGPGCTFTDPAPASEDAASAGVHLQAAHIERFDHGLSDPLDTGERDFADFGLYDATELAEQFTASFE